MVQNGKWSYRPFYNNCSTKNRVGNLHFLSIFCIDHLSIINSTVGFMTYNACVLTFSDGKLLALLYESGSQMDSILEIRSQQDNFKSDLDKTTSRNFSWEAQVSRSFIAVVLL